MTIGGSNNQCDINGTFTQEGSVASNLNVFDVSITYTQEAGCPESGSGVGFESSVDYFNVQRRPTGPLFLCSVIEWRIRPRDNQLYAIESHATFHGRF